MNTCVVNALNIILHETPQISFFIVETYLRYLKSKAESSFSLLRLVSRFMMLEADMNRTKCVRGMWLILLRLKVIWFTDELMLVWWKNRFPKGSSESESWSPTLSDIPIHTHLQCSHTAYLLPTFCHSSNTFPGFSSQLVDYRQSYRANITRIQFNSLRIKCILQSLHDANCRQAQLFDKTMLATCQLVTELSLLKPCITFFPMPMPCSPCDTLSAILSLSGWNDEVNSPSQSPPSQLLYLPSCKRSRLHFSYH
jgi:hypothetical protein